MLLLCALSQQVLHCKEASHSFPDGIPTHGRPPVATSRAAAARLEGRDTEEGGCRAAWPDAHLGMFAAMLLLFARPFRRCICRRRRGAKGDSRGMRCSNVCGRLNVRISVRMWTRYGRVRSLLRCMHGACMMCTSLHATGAVVNCKCKPVNDDYHTAAGEREPTLKCE